MDGEVMPRETKDDPRPRSDVMLRVEGALSAVEKIPKLSSPLAPVTSRESRCGLLLVCGDLGNISPQNRSGSIRATFSLCRRSVLDETAKAARTRCRNEALRRQ